MRSSVRTTSAWKRETLGSSSTTSLPLSRPIVIRSPGNWIACVVAISGSGEDSKRVSCPVRKRSASPPISTVSPLTSQRDSPRMRSPLTCVPLRELRSTIQ